MSDHRLSRSQRMWFAPEELDHRLHAAVADRSPHLGAVRREPQHRRIGTHRTPPRQVAVLVAVGFTAITPAVASTSGSVV